MCIIFLFLLWQAFSNQDRPEPAVQVRSIITTVSIRCPFLLKKPGNFPRCCAATSPVSGCSLLPEQLWYEEVELFSCKSTPPPHTRFRHPYIWSRVVNRLNGNGLHDCITWKEMQLCLASFSHCQDIVIQYEHVASSKIRSTDCPLTILIFLHSTYFTLFTKINFLWKLNNS